MLTDCPFCRSSVGKAIFAESENFLAIYNIAPILPGHSLIVPRRHVGSFLRLEKEEQCEITLFGVEIVKVLKTVFNSEAFNWTIQEGEEAGQSVPHFHLHLIPRKPNDLEQPGDWYPKLRQSQSEIIDSERRPRLNSEEMGKIVSHLRKYTLNLNI